MLLPAPLVSSPTPAGWRALLYRTMDNSVLCRFNQASPAIRLAAPWAAAISAPWTAKPMPAPLWKTLRCAHNSCKQAQQGVLPSVLMQMFFAYAFGKPVEVVDVGNGDSQTRTITITF